MGGVKTVVAHTSGWQTGWKASERLGSGVLGLGEIPVGSSDFAVVTPTCAAIPSQRASGVPSSLFPPRARGNLRTCPGNSVVVVAFDPEGVAWYAALQSAWYVVGRFRRA